MFHMLARDLSTASLIYPLMMALGSASTFAVCYSILAADLTDR